MQYYTKNEDKLAKTYIETRSGAGTTLGRFLKVFCVARLEGRCARYLHLELVQGEQATVLCVCGSVVLSLIKCLCIFL
jgi:hypothetical protein